MHSVSLTVPTRHPRQQGEKSRDRIKAELRRRKAASLPAPTLEELAEAIGRKKTTVHHHVEWMEAHRIIRVLDARREIILLDDPTMTQEPR